MKRFLPSNISPEQVTTCVGLISDTHMPERWRTLPTAVSTIFSNVDLILHAGDVGELWVLDELSRIAPVTAVHGNDETEEATRELPYQQLITISGQRILLWHNHYQDRIDEMASRKGDNFVDKLERSVQRGRRANASLVVMGHWHIPLLYEKDGVQVVNPGAIASGNFMAKQAVQTVALLFMLKNGRFHITHVNLAQPGIPYTPPVVFEEGFVANLKKFSDTILAEELTAVQHQLFPNLYHLAPKPLTAIWYKLAHECWAGQRNVITIDALLQHVAESPAMTDEVKEQVQEGLMGMVNE